MQNNFIILVEQPVNAFIVIINSQPFIMQKDFLVTVHETKYQCNSLAQPEHIFACIKRPGIDINRIQSRNITRIGDPDISLSPAIGTGICFECRWLKDLVAVSVKISGHNFYRIITSKMNGCAFRYLLIIGKPDSTEVSQF